MVGTIVQETLLGEAVYKVVKEFSPRHASKRYLWSSLSQKVVFALRITFVVLPFARSPPRLATAAGRFIIAAHSQALLTDGFCP